MAVLELRGISKRFDAVQALLGVDLAVETGEVLALVGDNGAGKSTLIKIISGVYPPDAGDMWLDGRHVHITSPEAAKMLGIETVYQDLALFEHADVSANLFAGREVTRRLLGIFPILDEAHMREFARQTLARLRIQIPGVDRSMKLLSGGQRQSVAIGRAIAFGTKLVIMDEPTACSPSVTGNNRASSQASMKRDWSWSPPRRAASRKRIGKKADFFSFPPVPIWTGMTFH